VGAQLIESKTEREDVLDRVDREFSCRTFLP
jgi:hypothetical protein